MGDQITLLVVAALIVLAFALCGVVVRCLTLLDSERQRGNRAARDAAGARADANTWAQRARNAERDAATYRKAYGGTEKQHFEEAPRHTPPQQKEGLTVTAELPKTELTEQPLLNGRPIPRSHRADAT